MAVVVVGGHARNIGKTSVVAGLIALLPHLRWTAFKITQFGHGVCSADGQTCDCQTGDHAFAVSEERGLHPETDSGRFLAAGAERSLWVRTRQGQLFSAMPRLRAEMARSENAILESNSIVQYLRPDLYLTVLDPSVGDVKASARRFLDRADAVLLVGDGASPPDRSGLLQVVRGKRIFRISAGQFVSAEVAAFVAERVGALAGCN